MTSNEWNRLRAGFAVQGPYRRRGPRIPRWVLAVAVIAALIVWRL